VRRVLDGDAVLSARHRWLDPTLQGRGTRAADSRPAPAARAGLTSGRDVASKEPPAVLVEALTPKELEVLERLAELLTTDEIAAAMFVSVNTVRTHVRSILRKLGVSRRNAAVRRARELHLLAS
jgi:LuxR family maltose regulon positive regulatory protein